MSTAQKSVGIAQRVTLTAVTPEGGEPAGYDGIQLHGNGFADGMRVFFGEISALAVTRVDLTKATVLTPPHAEGTVDIKVVNPDGGEASLADAFTFDSWSSTTVWGVTPAEAPTTGGATVTITGRGFKPESTVVFGNTPATSVTVHSSTRITAVTPPRTRGYTSAYVQNSATDYSSTEFYFFDPAYRITSITPATGPLAGGTSVTIAGTGFAAGSVVEIGNVPLTNVTILPDRITGTTPATDWGPAAESVTVEHATKGNLELVDGFNYYDPAFRITSITPAEGSSHGGTPITIKGSGFNTSAGTYGTTIYFRSGIAMATTVVDATTIRAVTPAGDVGWSDIEVYQSGNNASVPKAFRYRFPPVLASISPSAGHRSGGTAVTITGVGFLPGATVKFGGVAATSVVVVSPERITAIAPAHADGPVDVVVRNTNGVEGTGYSSYTYIACVTPPAAVVSGSATTCSGTARTISATLTGRAPWTITWSDGVVQSGIVTSPATRSVTPSTTTTYTITSLTDADCAGTATGSATVTVKPTPSSTIESAVRFLPSSAANALSVPDAGTGATYSWSVTNGTIASGAGTRSITVNVGTATPLGVTVLVQKDGCSSTGTKSIPVRSTLRGDANDDNAITATDIFYLINHLFAGGPAPTGDGDANSDGAVGSGDIFYLINHLFAGGPPPGP